MNSKPLTIIKVGGSLLDWPELPRRLIAFLDRRRAHDPDFRPALFCGGGPFVDSVRRLDRIHHLGDFAAHKVAIQAMGLASTVLLCMLPRVMTFETIAILDDELPPDETLIFVPGMVIDELEDRDGNPLPPSWDVTSDTLSAWVAGQLRARSLILLKSVSLPPHATRERAAELRIVDPFFPLISTAVPRVEYLNLRDTSATEQDLP